MPSRLRIAMFSVHTCPLATLGGKETGGMNVYVRDLTRELARRGHRIDVFTRSQDPLAPQICGILGDYGRVIHIPTGPERPYDKNLIFDNLPEFISGVEQFAGRHNLEYDLIHSNYWLSGVAALELRKKWHIPVIQMFHTLAEVKNQIASPQEFEPAIRINNERELMQACDKLIASTPLEKGQMIRMYDAPPEKITVVPPGVDLTLFKPLPKSEARSRVGVCADSKVILFVGRLQPLKGINILFESLAQLLHWHPDLKGSFCLVVIGGAPESEQEQRDFDKLLEMRDDLGLKDIVIFPGAKNQDTLVYYYSAAEMVVVPSFYESFGMVALEAMACGIPVIASDVGGLSLNIQNGFNGYKVHGRDAKALSEKIALLLHHPDLAAQLGRNGQVWAEHFSWSNIATELEAVYNEVIYEKVNSGVEICR